MENKKKNIHRRWAFPLLLCGEEVQKEANVPVNETGNNMVLDSLVVLLNFNHIFFSLSV